MSIGICPYCGAVLPDPTKEPDAVEKMLKNDGKCLRCGTSLMGD